MALLLNLKQAIRRVPSAGAREPESLTAGSERSPTVALPALRSERASSPCAIAESDTELARGRVTAPAEGATGVQRTGSGSSGVAPIAIWDTHTRAPQVKSRTHAPQKLNRLDFYTSIPTILGPLFIPSLKPLNPLIGYGDAAHGSASLSLLPTRMHAKPSSLNKPTQHLALTCCSVGRMARGGDAT